MFEKKKESNSDYHYTPNTTNNLTPITPKSLISRKKAKNPSIDDDYNSRDTLFVICLCVLFFFFKK
jgi:hypothetical protein